MIASLLVIGSAALTAAPSDTAPSALSGPDHVHEWVSLSSEPQMDVLWDRNSIDKRDIGGTVYPTVLVRIKNTAGKEIYPEARDLVLAVNCVGNEGAKLERYTLYKDAEPKRLDAPETPRFEGMPAINSPETQAMMRAACGADWTL